MPKHNIVIITLQNVVIVVGSYFSGYYFTRIFHEPTSFVGGLWAAISGIIVIEGMASDTLRSAKTRITGSLLGAIISGVYLLFFNFSLLGYAGCIATGVLLCYAFKVKTAIKLTGITISVILIVSTIEKELHPIFNAGLRFAESTIGTTIALITAFITYYLKKAFIKSKSS